MRLSTTADLRRKVFASRAQETIETRIARLDTEAVKYDAEERAEAAILSRECMKHLGRENFVILGKYVF